MHLTAAEVVVVAGSAVVVSAIDVTKVVVLGSIVAAKVVSEAASVLVSVRLVSNVMSVEVGSTRVVEGAVVVGSSNIVSVVEAAGLVSESESEMELPGLHGPADAMLATAQNTKTE